MRGRKRLSPWNSPNRVHDSQPLSALLDQLPTPSTKSRAMGPTTRGAAMRQCSSVRPRQPLYPGARLDRAPLRILWGGVPRVIGSCSRVQHTDAQRGGCAAGTRGRVSPRIRCIGSSSYSGGTAGRGIWRRNAPSPGEMLSSQSYAPVGDARDGAHGVIRSLPWMNCS